MTFAPHLLPCLPLFSISLDQGSWPSGRSVKALSGICLHVFVAARLEFLLEQPLPSDLPREPITALCARWPVQASLLQSRLGQGLMVITLGSRRAQDLPVGCASLLRACHHRLSLLRNQGQGDP